MKVLKLSRLLLSVAALSGCAHTTAAPPKTPGASKEPPPAPSGTTAAGAGFYLDVPKWSPAPTGHGDNTGLSIDYSWGSAGQRTVKGAAEGGSWRVVFLDRPGAQEVAKLSLHYAFALMPADRVAVKRAKDAVIQAATTVAATALQKEAETPKVPFDATVKQSIQTVVAAAKPLASYVDAANMDGATLVLRELGIVQASDGSWGMSDKSIPALTALAKAAASEGIVGKLSQVAARQREYKALATAADGACATAVAAMADDSSKAPDAAASCATALVASATARQRTANEEAKSAAAAVEKAPAEGKAALQPRAAQTQKTADDLGAKLPLVVAAASKLALDAKAPEVASGDKAAIKTLDADLGALALAMNAKELTGVLFPEYTAAAYAEQTASLLAAQHDWETTTAPLAAIVSRVESLEQDQIGSTLVLSGTTQARSYDLVTGVLYVPTVQEWVMPILVSVCPFRGGCLRNTETIWQPGVQWPRTVTFDVGVRAQTLGRVDLRDKTSPAFLAGASWNPISFLRFSAGGYFFENSQTGNKNAIPYFGASINMIEAASLLTALGLGAPSPAVVTPGAGGSP